MPSTYTPLLRAELQADGENDITWGQKANNTFSVVLEQAIAGMASVSMPDADYTLTTGFGVDDEARKAILKVSGALTADRNVIVPSSTKLYIVKNNTSGGKNIIVKTAAGNGVTIANGDSVLVYCNGTDVASSFPTVANNSVTPQKIDQTTANAWRFNSAVGIGYNQAYVAGFGALSLDGTSGSFINLFRNGSQAGSLTASASGFGIEAAANQDVVIKTANTVRVTFDKTTGKATYTADLAAPNGTFTGSLTTAALTVTGPASVAGVMTAAGYNGITKANIIAALGYTPVQQGTGFNQSSTFQVKLGWNSSTSRLRATVESTDLGDVVTTSTTGVFIPVNGGNGNFDIASNTSGVGFSTAAIQIRELNHGGAQGNVDTAMPRMALHWSNVAAAQVGLLSNGVIAMMDLNGTGRATIGASSGLFLGDVVAFFSDMRLKTYVGDIDSPLDKVRKLQGFYYEANQTGLENGFKPGRQVGLSAQQVKEVLPEVVHLAPFDMEPVPGTDGEFTSKSGKNYMTINYERIVPLLVEAIKELEERVAVLEKRK